MHIRHAKNYRLPRGRYFNPPWPSICTSPNAYFTTVQADTPLSYWRLDENSGTAALDRVGTNPGTYTGGFTLAQAGAIAGDPDTSVSLNGTTGYVSVPDAANLRITGDITIEAWVRPTDRTNYWIILGKAGVGGFAAPYGLFLNTGTGTPVFKVGNGTTQTSIAGTAAIPTGKWSHVAVTLSGNTVTHYLNGQPNGTGSVAGQPRADAGTALQIGAQTISSFFFKGLLDEVALYTSALSAAQVLAHYNAALCTGLPTWLTVPAPILRPRVKAHLRPRRARLGPIVWWSPTLTIWCRPYKATFVKYSSTAAFGKYSSKVTIKYSSSAKIAYSSKATITCC